LFCACFYPDRGLLAANNETGVYAAVINCVYVAGDLRVAAQPFADEKGEYMEDCGVKGY
jgi:hypothetical protein